MMSSMRELRGERKGKDLPTKRATSETRQLVLAMIEKPDSRRAEAKIISEGPYVPFPPAIEFQKIGLTESGTAGCHLLFRVFRCL
jgi:hypothetical protein